MKVDSQTKAAAYARGQAKARQAIEIGYEALIADSFAGIKSGYPPLAEMDLAAELLRLDRDRLANPPDPARFPETKGLPDLLREERRGFLDACGGNELLQAYTYSWMFLYTRRINTRYLPGLDAAVGPVAGVGAAGCTAIFIPNSTEGGPLYGRNWDVTLGPWSRALMEPPREGADGKRVMWTKGVSLSLFLDEEPREIFPVDPFELLPPECTAHVRDAVEFLHRYREFWGPGNSILVDTNLDSVAIEKANVRLGARKSDNGASAVTALACQVPEMKAHKEDCDRRSVLARGWTIEEAPDWYYWRGADQRYERLLQLTNAANRRGASLQDMANIATDHAVPFPARVCIAGEFRHPKIKPGKEEWTAVSHSEVLEGPNRRLLFYVVEDGKPCYATPPYLVPGVGVKLKPEWTKGTRPLPPQAAYPRPRIHAEHPNVRVML